MTWQWTRLKFLADAPINNGIGEAGGLDEPTWPRYIRTTDIASPRELRSDTFSSLPPDIAARAPLRRGDIVMTAAGATIGKSLLYTSDEPACYAGYLVRFRAKPNVDPRFISFWTESEAYWSQIRSGKVVSTIENFSASKYQKLRINAPAYDQQRAIADFLDRETARIDALLVKRRQMMDLLLARRDRVTLDAVSGSFTSEDERVPSALPWLDEHPDRWDEVLLRLVAQLGSGHTPSREHPEWWINCSIPWITTGEVAALRTDRVEYITETRECISELGLRNSAAALHPANTVVLCRTASAGYSGIMAKPMATSQDFATWTCGPKVRPRFLLLCLRAMRQDLLGRLAMGSTHKTIYMPDIKSIRIPLPPVEEQDAIVEAAWHRLAKIDDTVFKLTEQEILLKERRQALITATVTGQLDVSAAA